MKIAITGTNGLLGKRIITLMEDVVGFSRRDFDITDTLAMISSLQRHDFDVLIHTAALSDIVQCEENKEQALSINFFASLNLALYCQLKKKLFVFISTDYVFDGELAPYYEHSETRPINYYGTTKALTEEYIQKVYSDYMIVRLPILYGYNDKNDKPTFPRYVIDNLQKRNTFKVDNKRIKYPALIDDVVLNLKKAIDLDMRGIVHFKGARGITRYEWAKIIANVYGFDTSYIEPTIEENDPPRPNNVELLSTYNFSFTAAEQAILRLKNRGF